MTLHTFGLLCAWSGAALGLWGTIAQYGRSRRLGVEGVSLATWILFTFMGGYWMAYGLSRHSVVIVAGSAVLWPLQWMIVVKLRPWQRVRVVVRSAAAFVLFCVAPMIGWGWSGGVLGTGLLMVVTRWPQLVELVSSRDASGVSVATWTTGFVGSAVWTTYYAVAHLHAATWSNLAAGLMSLTIAIVATWRHRQSRAALIAAEVF